MNCNELNNIYDITNPPSLLRLGHAGEDNWEPQAFDLTPWIKKAPGGFVSIWLQPKDGAKFPVAVVMEGSVVTWTPKREELIAGEGRMQVVYQTENAAGMSAMMYYQVLHSIVGGDGSAETSPPWAIKVVEDVAAERRRAEAAAKRAEDAADNIDIDPEDVAHAVADYLKEHPVEGEPGASAYELAVEQGYTGTLEEWLASLHGRDGTNGKDGADGKDGTNGRDGTDGTDGVSPAVSVSAVTGGHAVTITDKDHPNGQTFNVMDGKDGKDGQDGQDGAPGPQGPPGANGADYVLTAADKADIAAIVIQTLPVWNGGAY